MSKTVYLDNAATTFPKPECVYKYMDEFYRQYGVNAGRSGYKLSMIANEVIQETRKELCGLVGIEDANKVIFTPSATIAMNQVLNGLDWTTIKNVYISPFEHNAVARTLYYLSKIYSFEVNFLDFNPNTFEIDTKKLMPKLVNSKPDLVCISHISNVTGYILPVEQLLEMIDSVGSDPIIVLDCAQSLGLINIDLSKLNIDYAIFAGHKTLYGPFGIAGIINNSKKVKLREFIVGGTGSDSTNLEMPKEEPNMYEAGSYNVQAIAGLNAAIKWIKDIKVDTLYKKEMELTNYLIDELEKLNDYVDLYLPKDMDRHIGILAFTLRDYNKYTPNQVADILDREFDICVRAGHHCSPYISNFFNVDDGFVRLSLSYFNSKNDIDIFTAALEDILGR